MYLRVEEGISCVWFIASALIGGGFFLLESEQVFGYIHKRCIFKLLLIIKHKKMETIIYKTLPSNSFNSNDCGDSIFRYFEGDHTLCFVYHLGEHNKSEYNYFVPTGSDSGIYFVKEIDAVNFGTNSYQYGVSKAWFSMGEYSEAHNYVFSDSPSL